METQLIQKIVDAIVFRESNTYDTVYLYGNTEHISVTLDEVEEKFGKHWPMSRIIRVNADTFIKETIHNALKGNFYSQPCKCDLYILENVEQIAGLEASEQRLYGILDWLLENGRQIIATGSAPTASIGKLAPRICAQLDGGVSFFIEPV